MTTSYSTTLPYGTAWDNYNNAMTYSCYNYNSDQDDNIIDLYMQIETNSNSPYEVKFYQSFQSNFSDKCGSSV